MGAQCCFSSRQKQAHTWSAIRTMNSGCVYSMKTEASTIEASVQPPARSHRRWRGAGGVEDGGVMVPSVRAAAFRHSRNGRVALYGAFLDGQIHEAREDAQRNGHVPHCVIAARVVVQVTAEPDTQEAADLVAEEYKS